MKRPMNSNLQGLWSYPSKEKYIDSCMVHTMKCVRVNVVFESCVLLFSFYFVFQLHIPTLGRLPFPESYTVPSCSCKIRISKSRVRVREEAIAVKPNSSLASGGFPGGFQLVVLLQNSLNTGFRPKPNLACDNDE